MSFRLLLVRLSYRLADSSRYQGTKRFFYTLLEDANSRIRPYFDLFMILLVLFSVSLLVIFEVDNPDSKINGFFDGIYWALVTVSTVGYGDIVPATPEGRFVTLLLILAGLGTFSFLASIIVSAFSEQLPELRRRQVAGELERRGGHTILCGVGRVGQEVAVALARDGDRLVVVDPDDERCRLAKRQGRLAIRGQAEEEEMLQSLHVHTARRILCLRGRSAYSVWARFEPVSFQGMACEGGTLIMSDHPLVIFGCGNLGIAVAENLRGRGFEFLLAGADAECVVAARAKGFEPGRKTPQ